jgi:hypothetical protein
MSVSLPPMSTVAALLMEAGRAHHEAFTAVNGADPDWPAWYAEYLSARLRRQGLDLAVSRLASELARLEAEHRATSAGAAWPEYYAARLLERYGRPGGPGISAPNGSARGGPPGPWSRE